MERPKLPPRLSAQEATDAEKKRLAAIGGEALAGSGFEHEEPDPDFIASDFNGPDPSQNPG